MSDKPKKKPTKDEARAVWDGMTKPSTKKVADVLIAQGFDTSKSTIARWVNAGWSEDKPHSVTLAEKGKVRGVAKEIREETAKVPEETMVEAGDIKAQGGLEQAMTGGNMKEDDYARISKLIDQLASLDTREKLLEEQEKARIIMNTVMMKEAARRAHIMVLIPKETSSLVKETNDAAGGVATVAPIEVAQQFRNGDNAKLIEGKVNEPAPLTPFQLALKKLREEEVA